MPLATTCFVCVLKPKIILRNKHSAHRSGNSTDHHYNWYLSALKTGCKNYVGWKTKLHWMTRVPSQKQPQQSQVHLSFIQAFKTKHLAADSFSPCHLQESGIWLNLLLYILLIFWIRGIQQSSRVTHMCIDSTITGYAVPDEQARHKQKTLVLMGYFVFSCLFHFRE